MLQVSFGRVSVIPLSARDLKILEQHGWMFILIDTHTPKSTISAEPVVGEKLLSEQSKLSDLGGLFFNSRDYIKRSRTCVPTCVSFAKRVLEIRAPFIQTPDQLYRFLVERDLCL
jgi:hypothetical protein